MNRYALSFFLVVCVCLLPCGAQTITVPGDYPTIQAAIAAVAPGGTILVSPGTYVEALVVDPTGFYGAPTGQPNFTIQGAGAGVILQWPSQATRSASWPNGAVTGSGKQIDAILLARGTTALALENLEFDGNDDMYLGDPPGPPTATASCAVAFDEGSGTMMDCTVHGVRQSATSGAQNGLAVYVQGASSVVTLTNSTFFDIQKSFIVASGDGTCNVIGCTLTGRGPVNTIAQNGVQFSSGGKGTVDGCVIDGFWWTGPTWTSTGILCYDSGTPIVIQNCTLKDAQTGIYWQSNTMPTIDLTITNCDLTNYAQAVNGFDGIDIYDNSGGVLTSGTFTIQNCSFNNLEGSGVWTNYGPGGTITGNYFNNTGAAFSYNNAQDDSAGGNNWDGNTWSDFTSNSGYPTQYDVPGTAGAVDNNPSGDCPDFGGTEVAVGSGPLDAALADLDGDGDLDIVTANSGSDDLTILTNDGAGGFGTSSTVALSPGDGPAAVGTGDVLGASDVDLVVAAKGAHAVKVIYDALSTTMTIPVPVGTYAPVDVCVADLDGAGQLDIAVALEGDPFLGGGGVAVILGGGSATLLPAPLSGFLSVKRVVCADLDGDGDLDVAATMAGNVMTPTTSDNVLLWQNDGLGGFTYEGALTTTTDPDGICAEDLDGDGDTDLGVAVAAFSAGVVGGVTIFDNTGLVPGAWSIPAAFSASPVFAGGLYPSDVVCTDLGDDSIPGYFSRKDLVTTNFGSANLSIFKGYDGSSFGAIQSCSAGLNPVALAAGEVNGDNTVDLVVANASAGTVSVIIAVEKALAQTFGSGCAGTGGLVPQISAVGLPTYGSPSFAVKVSSARPFSPALLAVSLGLLEQDLGTGCKLYVEPPLVLFQLYTDFLGEATLPLPVPPDVAPFSGLNAYFQWGIFDPAGTHLGLMAFSDALRIKFGN